MPVAVQAPSRRESRDPLETIMKGLTIASAVYGIKEGTEKAKLLQAQREEAAAQRAEDVAFRNKQFDASQENAARAADLAERKFDAEQRKSAVALRSPENQFKMLPRDKQIDVERTVGKVVDRRQIKHDIDAGLAQLDDPTISDDAKVAIGREMLKTLNSVQGSDAIGHEEAQRLGAKLQFAFGNFTNDNPTQFGRDIPGFTEAVRKNSERLGATLAAGQGDIDTLMGRTKTVSPFRVPDGGGGNVADSALSSVLLPPKANAAKRQVFKTKDIEWAD